MGRAAAPGAAIAPAFVLAPPLVLTGLPQTAIGAPEEELARLRGALERAESELRQLAASVSASAGEEEAEIFEAHAEFAADPELIRLTTEAVGLGASAERAVVDAFGSFRELLAASASEYLAARASDLDDVRDRVVEDPSRDEHLRREARSTLDDRGARADAVSDGEHPDRADRRDRDGDGLADQPRRDPGTSARRSRRRGVQGLLAATHAGVDVAIDGRAGESIVDSDPAEREEIDSPHEQEEQRRETLGALRDEPGRTADAHRVELAANIGSIDHIPAAIEAGGEGSGLVRTEFLFLGRVASPTVEEQTKVYAEILRGFPGQRVVFRTLDAGADKPLPFVIANSRRILRSASEGSG